MPAVASAATQSSIKVVHSAYMISAPKTGARRIALERAGSTLQLLSGSNNYWYHVKDASGRSGYLTTSSKWTEKASQTPSASTSTAAGSTTKTAPSSTTNISSGTSTAFKLPPGVTLDKSITPRASTSATDTAKFDAILTVAKSKLGTTYEWGHNEDRGQYGFDCSNFTEYVYHHALGYMFSTSSRTQGSSVGTPVSKADMQPGDLLVFNGGSHVGIYIGNNEMIQCGGGLKQVGYLSVAPNSYWGSHITAVKRMY